ncbi:hypothetical protein DL93DRAFT_2074937 [Clavulina sp. PMI_390]|nr:hypothetical protein DL93DRAFT_2074937 [Clavulina sp. PMI_390]
MATSLRFASLFSPRRPLSLSLSLLLPPSSTISLAVVVLCIALSPSSWPLAPPTAPTPHPPPLRCLAFRGSDTPPHQLSRREP